MSDYKEQCRKRYMENMKYEKYDKEDLVDEIIEMQGKIERLRSIIKEVREYITRVYDSLENVDRPIKLYEELLEILDKENNNE